MSFPIKGMVVEEMIDWIVKEVKEVSNTVWRLNDNFTILGIEGVLNMLHGEGCQELGQFCHLAISNDATILKDAIEYVRKLVERIVRRWWKPHVLPKALHRLEAACAKTVSCCTY
jgi:hypothetical protein